MKELQEFKDAVPFGYAQGAVGEHRAFKKTEYVATVVLNAGQKIYEYEIESGKLEEMQPEEKYATINGGVKIKMVKRHGCIYIAAINKKNAFRKVVKQLL